jgi:hypothetical protein
MKIKKEDLPIIMEAPDITIRALPNCGGITLGYVEVPKGTDFTPLLKGLENDSCHSAHWGYVLEGTIQLIYDDGKKEDVGPGEVFYWPAGHTAVVQEDIKFLEFSPTKEYTEVITHVGKKMTSMSA